VLLVFRKKILRGAVTNGHEWIFLLIKINDNYEGASYMPAPLLSIKCSMSLYGEVAFFKPWPDLIAAILLHWVCFLMDMMNYWLTVNL
jgi:hypothetical protein